MLLEQFLGIRTEKVQLEIVFPNSQGAWLFLFESLLTE